MPEGEGGDDSVQISGDRLKVLLESALAMFGGPGKEYIMEDLARHGITFDSKSHYTLVQIKNALSIILGEDGAALVTDRMCRELGRA
ncbi:hypothetical protein NTE_02373 [Candidatus Nitrososphaera evergladensis SR1]|uniref:Uncharacterized protein n=1 Tax=Candidatus Nitrososphaera evergladensis SR1 TaxID=1459636 RepID=A0A075MT88_9ARCH|nr:hypothetical protein [Candidatus Nitrososphaera evergladensis]AIF84425.1 hypothetical protein NTE_02373 [Candidatus Nitrososphaera evergladensis SR1]